MTHAIPLSLSVVTKGQGTLDCGDEIALLPAAQPIDVTGSCTFEVTRHVKIVELVCVSQAGSSPSFTIGIDQYDPGSNTYVNLITSAAITGAATTRVSVNPYIAAAANVNAANPVSSRLRATVTYTSGTATGSLSVIAN